MKAKPISYASLPAGANEFDYADQRGQNLYGYLSKPLIDSLVALLKGKSVLEGYAGRGHLSALLHERGVDVRSVSLRMGHDGSAHLGHVFDVEDCSIAEAIYEARGWMDALLVCWPTSDLSLYRALPLLPEGCPIIFIGEVTDYSRKPAFLGGCATDEFFDAVVEDKELTAQLQYPTMGWDTIKVFRRK
ncbi:hypothetical protein ACYPKM_02560 [Pseudomonas aeruginosa]